MHNNLDAEYELDQNYFEENNLLALSADIQYSLANQHCNNIVKSEAIMTSTESQKNCNWYHAFWQYGRLGQGIPSLDLHKTYYRETFTKEYFKNKRKILIAGTADYAILLHILRYINPKYYDKVEIIILDLCKTPIEICKWLQKEIQNKTKQKIQINYIQVDAINTGFQSEYFDIITCYSFLSRFIPEQRTYLLKEWNRILKQNGLIITSDRISPEYGTNKILPTSIQIEYFADKVKYHLNKIIPSLNITINMVDKLSYQYAKNIVSFSFPSEKYLCQLFKDYDCIIKSGQTPGELEFPETYAWIKAKKK